jgi:hypothetical protein
MKRLRSDPFPIPRTTTPEPAWSGAFIGFGDLAMTRVVQFTIGRYMSAVALLGYFCAFPELAVLLGIFVASLLFVAPVLVLVYFVCRFSVRNHRPSTPRP